MRWAHGEYVRVYERVDESGFTGVDIVLGFTNDGHHTNILIVERQVTEGKSLVSPGNYITITELKYYSR